MRFSWLILVIAFGMLNEPSGVFAQAKPPVSIVTIKVTDNYGHPLTGVRIRITGSQVDLDVHHEILELKYGTYLVLAELPGFSTFRKTVVIDQRDQLLRIGMRLGAYEGVQTLCSVDGRIEPSATDVRVRLLSMFDTDIRDVSTGEGGRFSF